MAHADTVLIVEDDGSISKLLEQTLKDGGFHPLHVQNGGDAIKLARKRTPALIILDIGLPDISGWDVLRIMKQDKSVFSIPVVILTGECKKTVDTIKGLEWGADDYIQKPFSPRVLLARLKAVLRRSQNGGRPLPVVEMLCSPDGQIVVNVDLRIVVLKYPKGKEEELKNLTSKEFDLLVCFLKHPGRVFSRKYLFELVWGLDYFGTTRTVDKHVERLRSKLNSHGKSIKTISGVGYSFAPDD
ncbi:MAG: response regulator transcription factor [Elusimicrobiota bacterium]|nr:response regulator transcription factor [Elusimicrobiota bacterium]